MKFPRYIRTVDGYIGTLTYIDNWDTAVYRFPGGERIADRWEIENGSDSREDLEAAIKHEEDVDRVAKQIQEHPWYKDTPFEECRKMAEYQVDQWEKYAAEQNQRREYTP